MLGLRPEFTKEILELLDKEFQNTRRKDSKKIQELKEEIKLLKQRLVAKDDEIELLKRQLENKESHEELPTRNSPDEPPSIKKCVSLTANKNFLKPREKPNMFDSRLTKSMYENYHLLPTQYSDSEDGDIEDKENESQIRVSPRKSQILFSSQGSTGVSPKRKAYFNTKTKDFGPLRKVPRLDAKLNFEKDYPIEVEVSRSTEEEAGAEKEEIGLRQNSQTRANSPQVMNSQGKTNGEVMSTQYSSSLDLQNEIEQYLQSSPAKGELLSSPTKQILKNKADRNKKHEQEEIEVIEDSQETPEDLVASSQFIRPSPLPVIEIPPEYTTTIQQRKFREKFYIEAFNNDSSFKINFRMHPIKVIKWDHGDFIPNKNYKLNAQMQFIKRNNIKSKEKYEKFIKVYGDKPEVQKFGKFEDVMSQIFDKFQSPPGFMRSEFPDTQEQLKRREIIQERQEQRIFRRIFECTKVEDGVQKGEFIFAVDIFNKYVIANRYDIE